MIAEELISYSIPSLKTSDSASKALTMMEEYKVTHLPIVNSEQFLGLISENDILDINEPDEPLGNHSLSLTKPYVLRSQHILDVLKLMSMLNLSLIPVLDDKNNYLGTITLKTLLNKFSEFSAIQNPGGIIILELNSNDYTLAQISQIVESNDAKILNMFVTAHPDSTKIDVTIKINRTDITPILKTFTRYDYVIKASFGEESYYDDLKERYDSFMNYLNI
ncbi:MAG: CBS domain-containing protein [Bacteroidales bacterium]|nr:CBS domain-containing protein [Bacteroidales bacterium]